MSLYSPTAVANVFLEMSFRGGNPIDPMKIQKLLYIAHGYVLVDYDRPLVDELFEAWRFGPVLPSLYHKCKYYEAGPIGDFLTEFDMGSKSRYKPRVPKDTDVMEQIQYTWENYGSERAIDLSAWTHEKDGPWDSVRNSASSEGVVYRNQTISNALIKEYFRENLYK
jgi:uncharacterized phage-associated protein